MLTAADDALKSAAEAPPYDRDRASKQVDKKFEETIHLLSRFEKDFPSKDLNIGGTVTRDRRDAKMPVGNKFESPSMILYALKTSLHSKVKFLLVSLSLNADRSQPMGDESLRVRLTRPAVEFHLLSSLPDAHPIVVQRECYAIDIAPNV